MDLGSDNPDFNGSDDEDEVPDSTETETTSNVVRNENPLTGDVLDKYDVRSLREATTVTFVTEVGGTTKIIARKETNDPAYGTAVLEREIPRVDPKILIHDKTATDPKSAAVVIQTENNPTWSTIVDSLREGDQLTLVFHLGFRNDTLQNKGIEWDRFGLIVNRFDGRGRGALRTFEFHVADTFGEGESNRMFNWQ